MKDSELLSNQVSSLVTSVFTPLSVFLALAGVALGSRNREIRDEPLGLEGGVRLGSLKATIVGPAVASDTAVASFMICDRD